MGVYRYGFNGKENDNEVKGDGNQQDYGFRIYDPRAGRFLSVDPLAKGYPELTPYQFSSNSPIANIDLDGGEAKYYTIELFKSYKNGRLVQANTRTTEETSKAAGWFINGKVYQSSGKLGNGRLYTIVTSETSQKRDGAEETTIKIAGAIYVPEAPKPDPNRPESPLAVNIIVFGNSMDPREGYGSKMNPNAKVFTIDFNKFNEYMDYITTTQPGELGKPTLERPSILDVIDWAGSNGSDIIETIKKAVPEKVGYCESCKHNYEMDGADDLSTRPSEKQANDTFPDHGTSAKPKSRSNK